MFFSSPATGSSASSWPEPRLTVRLNTNRQTETTNSQSGESLSVWTTSDSAHAGAWLNTDVDGWFVYVLYWVCNSYKHWQIWRAGSHSEPSALDARRNVVTFITNISPHLQELTVRWSRHPDLITVRTRSEHLIRSSPFIRRSSVIYVINLRGKFRNCLKKSGLTVSYDS